jgi:uncharacterized protein (TIGR02001 family)
MNKTKSAVLLYATLLAGLLPSIRAQTPATPAPAPAATAAPATPAAPAAPSASLVLTPSVVSQYMFRGVRLGGPAFEPSVEYDYGNLALGVWANTPIADKVPNQSDPEIDPYGSYTFNVNDNFSIAPGFTLYTYYRTDISQGFYRTTFEPNLAVNYTVGAVKFTPKVYYDVILKGPTYELTVAFTVPLKDLASELDFTAVGGTYKWTDAARNASPSLTNYGDYYLAGVSMPFQINKESKIAIGFAYTKGDNNYFKQSGSPKSINTAAVGRGVGTISYTYTF